MVDIVETGDNGFGNNIIQEARIFLATIVSALATIGNELYQWFLALGNRLLHTSQKTQIRLNARN